MISQAMIETLSFDFDALHAAYALGLTAAQVMAEVHRRVSAAQDDGIFLYLRDLAEMQNEAANLGEFDPAEHPLWGLPFAVKDNIDVANSPTTAGCPAFAYDAPGDAFVVAALRKAGAIPIGKTNLDQFATGLVGMRSPHVPPRNALDPEIVPGGSSSGSAVAVARGIVAFALGTDTAGSGRVPAALNNIVGLKPTLGLLSNSGVVPACRTLDTVSIFALTVPDAYRVFQTAAVYDPADAFARHLPIASLAAAPPVLVIGVPDPATREFFGDAAQAEAFAATLDRLNEVRARIVEIDFTPFYAVAKMLYEGAWVAERMTVVGDLMRRNPEAIHPVTRKIIAAADRLTAADAFRGIYRLAELKRKAEPALAAVDLLCVPSIPTFYSCADLAADPIGPNSRLGAYTNFVNLMDLCAIAVPTRPRNDGRPGGVTFIARAGRDGLVAALADRLHRADDPRLGATVARLGDARPTANWHGPDETVFAVVGAHMSGLPLNGELVQRQGRFLEATRTAPDYRFFALPGGPPVRPGLLRVPTGGASIALELWALPTGMVGSFLNGVPAPLSIGSIRLADGRSVAGFLAESAGTEGARDITHFGGWRAFLNEE